jgi:hypothetical protein
MGVGKRLTPKQQGNKPKKPIFANGNLVDPIALSKVGFLG